MEGIHGAVLVSWLGSECVHLCSLSVKQNSCVEHCFFRSLAQVHEAWQLFPFLESPSVWVSRCMGKVLFMMFSSIYVGFYSLLRREQHTKPTICWEHWQPPFPLTSGVTLERKLNSKWKMASHERVNDFLQAHYHLNPSSRASTIACGRGKLHIDSDMGHSHDSHPPHRVKNCQWRRTDEKFREGFLSLTKGQKLLDCLPNADRNLCFWKKKNTAGSSHWPTFLGRIWIVLIQRFHVLTLCWDASCSAVPVTMDHKQIHWTCFFLVSGVEYAFAWLLLVVYLHSFSLHDAPTTEQNSLYWMNKCSLASRTSSNESFLPGSTSVNSPLGWHFYGHLLMAESLLFQENLDKLRRRKLQSGEHRIPPSHKWSFTQTISPDLLFVGHLLYK